MKWIYICCVTAVCSFSSGYAAYAADNKAEEPQPKATAGKPETEVDQKGMARTRESIWKIDIEIDNSGKYGIRGSVFGIGDPVHETLTLKAIVDSGLAKEGAGIKDPKVVQYIRGVFWNDDPCAQLLTENEFLPLKPSFGAAWYVDFSNAGAEKNPASEFQQLSCPLLGRSHFGDLQFLHGMADQDGIKPAETLARLLGWASVTYRIAIGVIGANTPLSTDARAKSLLGKFSAQDALSLFRTKDKTEANQRALGSLLHMVQDTYAHGHVKREKRPGGEDGPVVQFMSYANQNAKKHAHDDTWRGGSTDLEKTTAIPGARDALKASTKIAEFYKSKAPWDEVEQYLKNGPLLMSEKAEVSGAGDYK